MAAHRYGPFPADAPSQYARGCDFELGINGVCQDVERAAHWFQVAADQGHAGAQYKLGTCCERGVGVPKSEHAAVSWYQQAAIQGYADAQCALGLCHQLGKGTPVDMSSAVAWFYKAAKAGVAEAPFRLALCYAEGKGVGKDSAMAGRWMRHAAALGHTSALEVLSWGPWSDSLVASDPRLQVVNGVGIGIQRLSAPRSS
jgi:TPR repeat protein